MCEELSTARRLKAEQVQAHQEVIDARRRGDLVAAAVAHVRWESVRAARIAADRSITRVRRRKRLQVPIAQTSGMYLFVPVDAIC